MHRFLLFLFPCIQHNQRHQIEVAAHSLAVNELMLQFDVSDCVQYKKKDRRILCIQLDLIMNWMKWLIVHLIQCIDIFESLIGVNKTMKATTTRTTTRTTTMTDDGSNY